MAESGVSNIGYYERTTHDLERGEKFVVVVLRARRVAHAAAGRRRRRAALLRRPTHLHQAHDHQNPWCK